MTIDQLKVMQSHRAVNQRHRIDGWRDGFCVGAIGGGIVVAALFLIAWVVR